MEDVVVVVDVSFFLFLTAGFERHEMTLHYL